MKTITILSPVVSEPVSSAVSVAAQSRVPAVLPARTRLATLSNGKPNTSFVLDGVIDVLTRDPRISETLRRRKQAPSGPATNELIDELVAQADLVVNATGD